MTKENQQSLISTTIMIESPPMNSINGKEGVDLALVCAAFDHQVNLVFIDAGVLHLLNNQDDQFFADKMHDKQLQALEFYDIDNIYAEQESLTRFNITQDHLIKNIKTQTRSEIKTLCNTTDNTVIF